MSQNSVKIEVSGDARGVERDLVESEDGRYEAGVTSKKFEDGSNLVYEGSLIQKDIFSGETVQFTLQFKSGVAAGIIANYLYDRLKDYDVQLRISNREIEVEKESIQSTLDEFEE